MSQITTPAGTGQESVETLEAQLQEKIQEAAELSNRLIALRGPQEPEREEVPPKEPPPPHPIVLRPAFALRSDGVVLLDVDQLGGRDVGGRETWTGVVVHGSEAAIVLERADDALQDAASRLAITFPRTMGLVAFPEFGIFMMVKSGELPEGLDPELLSNVKDGTLLYCPPRFRKPSEPEMDSIGEFEVICDHVCRAANKVFGTNFKPEDFDGGLAGENVSGGPCECGAEARAKHSK